MTGTHGLTESLLTMFPELLSRGNRVEDNRNCYEAVQKKDGAGLLTPESVLPLRSCKH